MAAARACGQKAPAFNVQSLDRIIAHSAEDMTVTVESGLALAKLQARLARGGQWLPVDPPHPETVSISELLNANLNGPHRFGYGSIREHLLGITVVLADGRVIHSGGRVVKNVAGYDLCKLFVGSQGTLGLIVEATFKVRPLPETEQMVASHGQSLSQVAEILEAVHNSPLTPVVLDLHNLNPQGRSGSEFQIILSFAGTREEVEWQTGEAAALGFNHPATLDYEEAFWNVSDGAATHCVSTLPSKLTETVANLGAVPFVARAGNGVLYYRGGETPPKPGAPIALMRRIKEAYDPKHLLPEFSWPAP
jgi:FAD/FMN-containing dehydrogenase